MSEMPGVACSSVRLSEPTSVTLMSLPETLLPSGAASPTCDSGSSEKDLLNVWLGSPALKNGLFLTGALKNGALKNGALKNGALKKGTELNCALKKGALKKGALKKGALKKGALKNGALKKGDASVDPPSERMSRS